MIDWKTIMPNAKAQDIRRYAQHIEDGMARFGITTRYRQCAFIAQLAVESQEFAHAVENLNYSAERLRTVFPRHFNTNAIAMQYARRPEKIASRVYGNRLGNGNEASGEGWKYRGRGLIQITGKSNYYAIGKIVGKDYVNRPEQVETAEDAALTACAWWKMNDINALCDRLGDETEQYTFRKICEKVNGGMNGYAERCRYYERARKVIQ